MKGRIAEAMFFNGICAKGESLPKQGAMAFHP